MSSLKEIRVPNIGDFKDIPIVELRVRPGDTVAVDDTLLVLESEKAALDVPSPAAGRVHEIKLAAGALVSEGTVILTMETNTDGDVGSTTAAARDGDTQPTINSSTEPPQTGGSNGAAGRPDHPAPPDLQSGAVRIPHAGPSLRKVARELGVDLASVRGTGPRGRILKQDVFDFIKTRTGAQPRSQPAGGLQLQPWPQVDFAKFGSVDRIPLSRIQQISGANLSRNWVVIPHVTNFEEADITELEEFRKEVNAEQGKSGPKVTLLAFIVKAVAAVLKKIPAFNSSLEERELVLKRYYHVGFAADTPSGLLVPVIRNADTKGVLEIATELTDLAAAAREGRLRPSDMQGGTFTISSLGGIGGTGFAPIINAPEVAILGVTRAQMKPIWDGSAFQPRLILPMSLGWDHRVVDGAAAARFLVCLAQLLADFRRMTL
jgi:pyruvate dehydrogenase E2 component (dihydrolipoamide acetyltransferase)